LRLSTEAKLEIPNILEAFCVILVIMFAVSRPSGGAQFLFPLLAGIVIYTFSFDQGRISRVLRSRPLQNIGLWSYSIYMTHTFVYQVLKMAVSFLGHRTHLELVGWHNDEKLVLLGTPDQAVLPTLILTVVLVVPIAALTYRWIEKPAMDLARAGLPATSGVSWSALAAFPRRQLGRWFQPAAPTAPKAAAPGDALRLQGQTDRIHFG
jgi:peptidoglycan/LPS O-acetylase OafA/YrhL